jgi:hypothetical protein
VGTLHRAPFHVVWVQHGHRSAVDLVHTRSGRRLTVAGVPVASLDGRYLVTTSHNGIDTGNANRVEVWALVADSLALEWSAEPTDWLPFVAYWRDDSTFAVVQMPPGAKSNRDEPLGIMVMGRRGGAWTRADPDRLAWARRDYGIGVVAYATADFLTLRDTFYDAAGDKARIAAVLDGSALCFPSQDECARSFERMIEYDYETAGWAILAFSADSRWAQITLDPRVTPSPTGWVRLRPGIAEPRRWSELLPKQRLLFFLLPDSIRFYSAPHPDAGVSLALAPGPQPLRFDYTMRPLEVHHRWLRVVVETPSTFCVHPPPRARYDTAWVEYLTPRGRPRVFFHTRGC